MHATSLLDMPVRSISRCTNPCHVSHSHIREDGGPDGTLNAAFPVVSFSRLVHPSLLCHLVPSQPPQFTQEPERFQEFKPQPRRPPRSHAAVRPDISNNTKHGRRGAWHHRSRAPSRGAQRNLQNSQLKSNKWAQNGGGSLTVPFQDRSLKFLRQEGQK